MKRRSTDKPTQAEAARMAAIKEHGCIIARHLGIGCDDDPVYAEIHHLTVGGRHGQKRLGHMYTVGLNPWSHRGVPFATYNPTVCREMFGPSYALEPRAFRELYSDEWLLAKQDELLGVSHA